jgi:sorting nexin-27
LFFFFESAAFVSERKLQPHELPHSIYIQNYSTATATCLTLKRWLFSLQREATLYSSQQALSFLFNQVQCPTTVN